MSGTDRFLFEDAVVIDSACEFDYWRTHLDQWQKGGTTVCVLTVSALGAAREALFAFGRCFEFIRNTPGLRLATSVEEIRAAKAAGEMAVVFHFQGTRPLEYEPSLIEAYWRMGLRIVQVAYNRRGIMCDGCEEPQDAGLSKIGEQMLAELNRLGILVDVSHTGWRSALEVIEASTAPVIASHSNAHAVHPSTRNIPDEVIKAIAASGGVIGMNGLPFFVAADTAPTLDQFIDHMVHVDSLVGTGHVGLGIDYCRGTQVDDDALLTMEQYEGLIKAQIWRRETYPPPPFNFPEGLGQGGPSGFPKLAERMLERGYTADEVRGVLGENWLRVYGQVWT